MADAIAVWFEALDSALTAAPSSSRAGWVAPIATICIWIGFILVSRAGGKGVLTAADTLLHEPLSMLALAGLGAVTAGAVLGARQAPNTR